MKSTFSRSKFVLVIASALVSFIAEAGPNLVVSDSTVYDKKTDLTWQRCSVGLRWNPTTSYCVGIKKTMTFDEANASSLSGGWRMPTIDELRTLLEK